MKTYEKNKRVLDKKVQKAYYESHEYDEYLLSKGFEVPRDEIHEINFGVNKSFEKYNMIALSKENHRLAHQNLLTKRMLYLAKLNYGFPIEEIPENIRIEFDLD